jgi:hypothetical protein
MTNPRESPTARRNAQSSSRASRTSTATILAGVALWLASCGDSTPPPNPAVEPQLQRVCDRIAKPDVTLTQAIAGVTAAAR